MIRIGSWRLRRGLLVCLFLFLVPSGHCGDFDGLIRVFAGFKGQPGLDYYEDGTIDHLDVFAFALDWKSGFAFLEDSSPAEGEGDVSLTRESILRFSGPLDESTVSDDAVYATFAGERIPARVHLSPDKRKVTLFYSDLLPRSARIRVMIDGNLIRDFAGSRIDPDRDGQAGGLQTLDFDTVALGTLPGTKVYGRVFATHKTPAKQGVGEVDIPLDGARITVDGAEETYRTVTDSFGNFTLDPCPVGRFFIHIDGRTVAAAVVRGVTTETSYPDGYHYPDVAITGETRARQPSDLGNIYLPLVTPGTLVPASATEDTTIGFSPEVLAEFPEFADVHIVVPADSLYADDGTRGGRVGIVPIPPDRNAFPLPEDFHPPLFIDLQTDGPANFDVPVVVCLPNLPDPDTHETLAPGAKTAFFSYNYAAGDFEMKGPMTVSQDGRLICTDPGVGVTTSNHCCGYNGSGGSGGNARRRCGGNTKEDGEPKGGVRPSITIGPISLVGRYRGSYTFSIPQPSQSGTITWSFSPDPYTVINGSGLTSSVLFCSPGVKQVQATFSGCRESAAAFTTVEVSEQELGDREPNISILGGNHLAGNTIQFDAGLPSDAPGTVTWRFEDATASRIFSRQSGAYGKAHAVWCEEGNFGVTVDYEDCAGTHNTDTIVVSISPVAGYCAQYIGSFQVEEPPEARISGLPIHITDISAGLALSRVRVSAPGADTPSLEIPASDGFFQGVAFDLVYDTIGPKTVTIEAFPLCAPDQYTSCLHVGNFEIRDLPIEPLSPPKSESHSPSPLYIIQSQESGEDPIIVDMSEEPVDFDNTGIDAWDFKQVPEGDVVVGPIFFAAENLDADFVTRGRGGSAGVVHARPLRLAPDALYRETVLHAASLEVATVEFVTPESGRRFTFPDYEFDEDTSPDSDGDGLHDAGEFVMGTDPDDPDSDNDGVLDGPEVQQGLDPLEGTPAVTGIIASADTPGGALDVCAIDNLAVIADGTAGVTVFNIFNGMNPVRIAQVDTPGNAASVACDGRLVAVADGAEGLAVIDLSDPPAADIIRQVPFESEAVAVAATLGVAYVALDEGALVMVQMETGLELGRLWLGNRADDLVLAGNYLYAHEADSGGRVSAVPLNGSFAVAGSANPISYTSGSSLRQRIFAGGGVAYSVHDRGYSTFDLSDPDAPSAIATGETGGDGWKQIVLNGSGLGVAAVGDDYGSDPDDHAIHLYDTTDATQTTNLLQEIETPGLANAVSIFNGLAYVADGAAGLQVINYLAYDVMDMDPTIQLVTNFAPGLAEEGQIVTVTALVDDDVQVRKVEFLLNGEPVTTDGAFPFEFRFVAPLRSEQASVTVQARATDTGGNSTTVEQALTLTDDATPPEVIAVGPTDQSDLSPGAVTMISAFFSEPILADTLNAETFQLVEAGDDRKLQTPDDKAVGEGVIHFDPLSRAVRMAFGAPLLSGPYTARLSSGVTDLRGNALAEDFEWEFTVEAPQVSGMTPRDGALARAGSVSAILAVFDVDMDVVTIDATTFRLFSPGNDGDIGTGDDEAVAGGVVDYQTDARTARIVFSTPLRPGVYRAVVSGSVQDNFGDTLAVDVAWTFTVEAPRVLAVTPPNGSRRGENRIFQIQAAFSADMNRDTLTPATFQLFEAGTDGQLSTGDDLLIEATSVYYREEPRRAYLTLPGVLGIGEYRGVISSAVADTLGDHLTSDFHWSFSVIEPPYDRLLFDRPALMAGRGTGDAVIADFNLDRIDDLAVVSANNKTIRIYLGDGGGIFLRSAVDYDVGIPARRLAVADLNDDRFPDIVGVQNASYSGSGSTVSVLLNQGAGVFGSPLLLAQGETPYDVAVADFDGDGDEDLAVTNIKKTSSPLAPGEVILLINRGAATFDVGGRIPTGIWPTGIVAEDFDQDGDADLAVVCVGEPVSPPFPGALFIYRNGGAANFSGSESFSVGVYPLEIAAGDINRDGRSDLVVANDGQSSWGGSPDGDFSVFLASANGGFTATTTLTSDALPQRVTLGDIDLDGNLDLLATAFDLTGSGGFFLTRLGSGDGTFQAESLSRTSLIPDSVAIGDLNQKDGPDVALSTWGQTDSIWLEFGLGDGTFEPLPPYFPAGVVGPGAAAAADFNGDTHQDVLVMKRFGDPDFNALAFIPGSGTGTFGAPVEFLPHSDFWQPRAMAVADFNGDTTLDAAMIGVYYQGSSANSPLGVFTNDGQGVFTPLVAQTLPWGVQSVVAARIDADADMDLVVGDGFASFRVLLNNGDATFTDGPVTALPSSSAQALAAADLNSDGKTDVVVGYEPFHQKGIVRVFLGQGDGTFDPSGEFLVAAGEPLLAIDDFTGDGTPDILAVNSIPNDATATVLRGLGGGNFETLVSLPVAGSAEQLAVGDIDGDGRPDAAVAAEGSDAVAVLLGRGDLDGLNTGDFARQPLFLTAARQPKALALGDFDEDGDLDITASYQYRLDNPESEICLLENRRIP